MPYPTLARPTRLTGNVLSPPHTPLFTPDRRTKTNERRVSLVWDKEAAVWTQKQRTAHFSINDAQTWLQSSVLYHNTIRSTTHSSNIQKLVSTKETIRNDHQVACMPRWNRLKEENGLDAFDQDSPVWRKRHWLDKIDDMGLTTEVETEQHEGGGVVHKEPWINLNWNLDPEWGVVLCFSLHFFSWLVTH